MSTAHDGQKPAPQKAATTPQQTKAETLRRLGVWKKGVTTASVAGFITISGVIVAQHTGATSTAAARTTTQVAAAWTARSATPATASATPSTQTHRDTAQAAGVAVDPVTANNPAPARTTKKTTSIKTAKKTVATKIAGTTSATAGASSTVATTATPTATATSTPAATATTAATATPSATATPAATATQTGGYSIGGTSTGQQPVATTSVS